MGVAYGGLYDQTQHNATPLCLNVSSHKFLDIPSIHKFKGKSSIRSQNSPLSIYSMGSSLYLRQMLTQISEVYLELGFCTGSWDYEYSYLDACMHALS